MFINYGGSFTYKLPGTTSDADKDTKLALFEEEKQNLYFDPVREVDSWAKVLVQLQNAPPGWAPQFGSSLLHLADDISVKVPSLLNSKAMNLVLIDPDIYAFVYCAIRAPFVYLDLALKLGEHVDDFKSRILSNLRQTSKDLRERGKTGLLLDEIDAQCQE